MKTQKSQAWNSQKFTQFGYALSVGYVPGFGSDAEGGDRWTARRHTQTSRTLGQGYNYGA